MVEENLNEDIASLFSDHFFSKRFPVKIFLPFTPKKFR